MTEPHVARLLDVLPDADERAPIVLRSLMGTSVEQIGKTYGHLLPG